MNFNSRSMGCPTTKGTFDALDRTLGEQVNGIFCDDLRNAQEITINSFRARGSNGLRRGRQLADPAALTWNSVNLPRSRRSLKCRYEDPSWLAPI